MKTFYSLTGVFLLAVSLTGACSLFKGKGEAAKTAVIDCGKAEIAAKIPEAVAVLMPLISGDTAAALAALDKLAISTSAEFAICVATRIAGADSAAMRAMEANGNGEAGAAKLNAQLWLSKRVTLLTLSACRAHPQQIQDEWLPVGELQLRPERSVKLLY